MGPAKGSIVSDTGPYSPSDRFALGEHRDRSVIAVKPLGREDMGVDECDERRHFGCACAHSVGQC